jgi:hypothetical protein
MSAFGSCHASIGVIALLPIITGYTGVKADLAGELPPIDSNGAKFGVVDTSVAGHKRRPMEWKRSGDC